MRCSVISSNAAANETIYAVARVFRSLRDVWCCRATRLMALFLAALMPVVTDAADITELSGRVVAAGIPGISAISAVGTFHPGGPLYDNPAFRASTLPGAILDKARILVASSSNFGAVPARAEYPTGSVLSIDPRGTSVLVVPPNFASTGNQTSTPDGRAMLYTAQSPAFLNRVYNATAATANMPAVANPNGISINNAFGRPWITSVPTGISASGLESVTDPDGRPLAGAPSKNAGGVFSGSTTNRERQVEAGAMTTGTLATALMGKSPDGGPRAVFAALNGDGSIVQIHVELGVDGLAPPGTIKTPDGRSVNRAGMLFNWVPDPMLIVSEPSANSLVVLKLARTDKIFKMAEMRRLTSPVFDVPVDLAPAVAEIANPSFSSNTTLAGSSDIYVANRGNGTIARIKQDGTVVAVARVNLPGFGVIGGDQINGIAVSPDASRIWISYSGSIGQYAPGAVIELPAIGAPTTPVAAR